ncbi:hypothetical protein ABW21_db0209329 [Orbilia brochopaga]|nr:hypothetical protein ABW21_db0209329 [Drechslerella brochopaga]
MAAHTDGPGPLTVWHLPPTVPNEQSEGQASEPVLPVQATTTQPLSAPAPINPSSRPVSSSSAAAKSRSVQSRSTARQNLRPPTPRHPFVSLLFGCLGIHSRPKYTKIQHIVLPTTQVCVDARALRFLQSLPRDEFQLLEYIVQEVFTDDGTTVLSRIPDYDSLIEAALKGQINLLSRPWERETRERYVEYVAAMYARLLRKMGTYERAPTCEAVYKQRWESRQNKST